VSLQGFINLKYTCYVNSVIQALFSLDNFEELVNASTNNSMVLAMRQVLNIYQNEDRKKIDLTFEINKLRASNFEHVTQQDAGELLQWMFMVFAEELPFLFAERFALMQETLINCDCGFQSRSKSSPTILNLTYPKNALKQTVQGFVDDDLHPKKIEMKCEKLFFLKKNFLIFFSTFFNDAYFDNLRCAGVDWAYLAFLSFRRVQWKADRFSIIGGFEYLDKIMTQGNHYIHLFGQRFADFFFQPIFFFHQFADFDHLCQQFFAHWNDPERKI
jgi:Ubiquitin carboxyl-terminal hydrolase